MRITALKPGVTTEYGVSVPVSTTVVVGDGHTARMTEQLP